MRGMCARDETLKHKRALTSEQDLALALHFKAMINLTLLEEL
jgi:hypothetical protein